MSPFVEGVARRAKTKNTIVPAATYSPRIKIQVPSALSGLTSVFGMGTGVARSQEPPEQ